MSGSTPLSAGEALAEIDRLLDRVDTDRSGVDARARLDWVLLARRVHSRVGALSGLLVTEADRTQASLQTSGTPTTSWLVLQENLTRREAAGALFQGRHLADHSRLRDAAVSGAVGPGQVRAIAKVLDSLTSRLNPTQQEAAEQILVGLAEHLDSESLAKSAGRVLELVAPVEADELLERKLQFEAETAQRERSLRFFRDGASIRFDGSLPRVDGERWITMLDAQADAQRRTAIEARDPLSEATTADQRRADALIAVIRGGSTPDEADGPGQWVQTDGASGRRLRPGAPRVIVTLDYDQLMNMASGAGLIGDGHELSAGELRRLCCEAELIPVVLGGGSQILDVGRTDRLVTPAIRTALIRRDRGCIFPGCDVPTQQCEAHHILPWWAGGTTALSNFVLLCHQHHALLEPARFVQRDQWQTRIAGDGLPEFIPPARLDAERRPMRHRRHTDWGGSQSAGPGDAA
ncbi:MAG TPA: DUF222 domain-containing protein [Propionibacteriaceae bacterium]|nr:DUF222 domain-containing protein [Propionibacteriaceae bacterium]